MLKLYNELIEVIEYNELGISLFFKDIGEKVSINFNQFNGPFSYIKEYDHPDQVLLRLDLQNQKVFYLFIKDQSLNWLITDSLRNSKNKIYDFRIQFNEDYLRIQQKNIASFQIDILQVQETVEIENIFTTEPIDIWIDCSLEELEKKNTLGRIYYKNHYLLILYYPDRNQMRIIKRNFEIIEKSDRLTIDLVSNITVKISIPELNLTKKVSITSLKKNRVKKLFGREAFDYFADENLLCLFTINKTRYYVFLKRYGVYIMKGSAYRVTQFKTYLKACTLFNHAYIFGRLAHHAYNSFGKYDYLYTVNEKHRLAKFKRPFRKIKFLKQFGYFKIPIEKMDLENRVHYPLFLGTDKFLIHKFPLGRPKKSKPSKVYALKKFKNKVLVMRTSIYKRATYTIVPYSEMYSFRSTLKIKLAHFLSKTFFRYKKYNINLFFEKQASKADESGIRVFEKVKENPNYSSKNYFILDKNSPAYPELKAKYGKDIIERFSFRHYLAIFNADYFISSDLSNHVINDRIYINEILDKIREVPLIFLQHGIMFAKPVENPLGKIFYKDYQAYNVYKNVVSSKLEAKEFYKMGYDDNDLIYSGLATFDYATLDKSSDKIVYMPTYRYWEEGMIYSGHIENTTYFKSILKVIKAFDEAGLRDKLMVVSHNKFAEYIYESMQDYRDVLGPNPSEALKVGRIFISDFSSAIYDAIYRGAYPIFYWEDKEYLTMMYGAAPPVNEENAPGPIAKSVKELIELVNHAISRSYELEEEYKEKYLQINSFNDNKNTERIVKYLEEDNIL